MILYCFQNRLVFSPPGEKLSEFPPTPLLSALFEQLDRQTTGQPGTVAV